MIVNVGARDLEYDSIEDDDGGDDDDDDGHGLRFIQAWYCYWYSSSDLRCGLHDRTHTIHAAFNPNVNNHNEKRKSLQTPTPPSFFQVKFPHSGWRLAHIQGSATYDRSNGSPDAGMKSVERSSGRIVEVSHSPLTHAAQHGPSRDTRYCQFSSLEPNLLAFFVTSLHWHCRALRSDQPSASSSSSIRWDHNLFQVDFQLL
jgi:hypothetical protein